jgi:hypothetical protein
VQLDMCGGADIGLTFLDAGQDLTLVAPGPSMDLRGELGGSLAVALRLVGGVNLIRQQFTESSGLRDQVPLWSGRIELAFSWDLR